MSLSPLARARRVAVPNRPALRGLVLGLSTAAACASVQSVVHAQVPEGVPAAAVVVTASRTPQRADEALAQVTVIDRARIEASVGRSLAELLATESGVQFWSNGGPGSVSSVSIRGLESRHTLLLIDGVRYGSATTGTPFWDNLPLEQIERIEIVRGPMSGLYGSDAVGGVVQVFTRGARPSSTGRLAHQGDASLTTGSLGHAEASAGLRWRGGDVDGSVRLQRRRSDGFSATSPRVPFGGHNPDADGFDQTSLSARLGLGLGTWRAEATLLQSDGTVQLDDGPGVDARSALRTRVVSAQARGAVAPGWRAQARWARSTDEYETLATASAFTPLGTVGTTQDQFSLEQQVDTAAGTALLLLERLEQQVQRPGTPFALGRRTIDGAGIGLNGQTGAHGWQANLRHDRNSQFGSQTTGNLAYGLQVAPMLRATASVGSSFVAPSFNLLYFPGFGNPRLLPEEGRQQEIGLVWRQGPWTTRLVYFDNRIRGYISGGPQPANIPRVRVSGSSLSTDARLGDWRLSASADAVDPLNQSVGQSSFGKVLPRRARDSARVAADWQRGATLWGAVVSAFGERFENAANTQRLGGYATLDLRTQWSLARDWTLAARLNNVRNKRYENVLGYNQPGREAYLTLRWEGRP